MKQEDEKSLKKNICSCNSCWNNLPLLSLLVIKYSPSYIFAASVRLKYQNKYNIDFKSVLFIFNKTYSFSYKCLWGDKLQSNILGVNNIDICHIVIYNKAVMIL